MRLSTRIYSTTAAALMAAVPLLATTASAVEAERPAIQAPAQAEPIPGQFIVTLSASINPQQILRDLGVEALFVYSTAMNGFTAKLSSLQVNLLRAIPGVEAIEQDATITAVSGQESRTAAPRQAGSWGIDRINQRDLPLDNSAAVSADGSGVTAYIVDSGIDFGHAEFGGRARAGFDAIGDGRNGSDCNGHGTHVAGTVAGSTYGVARRARLVSVRVLGCDGRGAWSGIIAGIDWVAANAVKPAVANISLGGTPGVSSVDQVANKLVDSGIFVAVASGNDTADACNYSPARAARVFTIGATTRDDQYAGYSNRGACVQLLAPGTDIVSAKVGGGSKVMSGTSMASPHVAGAAALFKQARGDASQSQIMEFLWNNSTADRISAVPASTPNRLLYVGNL